MFESNCSASMTDLGHVSEIRRFFLDVFLYKLSSSILFPLSRVPAVSVWRQIVRSNIEEEGGDHEAIFRSLQLNWLSSNRSEDYKSSNILIKTLSL